MNLFIHNILGKAIDEVALNQEIVVNHHVTVKHDSIEHLDAVLKGHLKMF